MLRMADALFVAKKDSRLPDLRGVMGYTVDVVILLAKSHRQMSEERKDVRSLLFSVRMCEAYVRKIPRIQNFCLVKTL